MKAYLDNNVVSSIVRDDNPSQSQALSALLEAFDARKVELVTSEITLEEIKKCPLEHRAPLERTFRLLEKIPVTPGQVLVGINSYGDGRSWINSPVIRNDPLFDSLLGLGLEVIDARHIFAAAKEGCTVFLTCDNSPRTGILRRDKAIHQCCGVQVQRPSEFVSDQGW